MKRPGVVFPVASDRSPVRVIAPTCACPLTGRPSDKSISWQVMFGHRSLVPPARVLTVPVAESLISRYVTKRPQVKRLG